MNGSGPRTSFAATDRLLVAAAFACAVLVFVPMLGHTFYRDDFRWVERTISAAHDPARWFTLAGTDFRPLASLSFVLNVKTSGLDPFGYYLFNLLLHLANVALLMAFVHRLSGGSLRAAGVAGLLFGTAFANYGEAIYWICGRTGPIADFFVLATLIGHWDGRARGASGPRILAWTSFALALLAKESAVVLLPLLAVVEWAHPARRGTLQAGLGGALRRLAPYAAMAAVYLPFQFLVWRAHSPILASEWVVGPHVLTNLLEYAVRMFLPLTPSSMMVALPPAIAPLFAASERILGIMLVLAWLVALFAPLPRAVKLALWWIPLTILPVTFFTYRTSTRYLYAPSMGVAMLAGMGVAAWMEAAAASGRDARRLRAVVAIVALALVVVVQAAVMGVILRQHHAQELREAPEEWARLRAHARDSRIELIASEEIRFERIATIDGLLPAPTAWSPSGRMLVLLSQEGLVLWDARSPAKSRTVRTDPVNAVSWRADGRCLVARTRTGEQFRTGRASLVLVSMDAGIRTLERDTEFRHAWFDTSGTVWIRQDGAARAIRIDDPSPTQVDPALSARHWGRVALERGLVTPDATVDAKDASRIRLVFDALPDGERFLVALERPDALHNAIVTSDGAVVEDLGPRAPGAIAAYSVNPTGTTIAGAIVVASEREDADRPLALLDLRTRRMRTVRGVPRALYPQFSREGALLAYTDVVKGKTYVGTLVVP